MDLIQYVGFISTITLKNSCILMTKIETLCLPFKGSSCIFKVQTYHITDVIYQNLLFIRHQQILWLVFYHTCIFSQDKNLDFSLQIEQLESRCTTCIPVYSFLMCYAIFISSRHCIVCYSKIKNNNIFFF